ncbi:homocysteine S-methyltransferase family protein, partial [bacterium]|nr:homocysteine S-methyltransferase family protein [bacterium]
MKKNILERMKESPVVFDGAMGTMIYDRGVFINTCYDELCLTNPDLIAEIHRAYVLAGADVIETNTFGANAIKLAQYGLADRVEEINREGARLARQVAGDDVYVAGSVGPCLRARQLLKEETTDRVQAAFRQQINVLAQAGVDFILLETFSNLDELRLATRIARETGLPVFASVTVDEEGKNAIGTPVEDLVSSLENDPDVDSIGINCGTGPASAYEAVDRALKLTTKPLFVMPNAGFPREQDGRMIYLASPEYITEYAKRFIARGVNAVGSCCGTTPEHTREIARAIKSLSGVKKHIQIQTFERPEAQVEVIPVEHRSRFANKIARGEEVTSVEILPPRSCDLTDMLEKARQCHLH